MENEQYEEEQIDIRQYIRVLLKRRWTIITVFALVVLSVAVITFTSTPIFQASARVVIEKENPNVMSIQEVMAVDATGSDYYQTQYKIIESRAVAREVIRRLDLGNSKEFNPEPARDPVSVARQWLSAGVSGTVGWIKGLIGDSPRELSAGADMEDASPDSGLVTAFIRRINVEPIRNSRLVDVKVEARDPVMAAKMANELVRAYIDRNLETKLQAAKDAVQWLSERIDEERQKVEAAENALLEYKERHGIITDFSSDAEQITAQKLASLNQQVVEAESRRVEAETRYKQALAIRDNPEMLDAIPEVLSSEIIKEMKKMEMDLYNRMSELSKKYGKRHPQMVALESELGELKKRKATEVKRVISSLRSEYQLALAREDSLKGALAQQKAETLELNKKAVQYGVLQRQAESARNMYELLVKRFKETSLTEEMKTGNIRIVDRAEVPRSPIKPKKQRNLLLSLVVGLALGIGLVFLLEYLDNTIKLPEEIKEHLKIPYLGPVTAVSLNGTPEGVPRDLVALHSPKSTVSESFRGIRTGILFSSAGQAPKTILVTSAGPEEGKTFCSANLAATMAQAGSRVALLDCDMRRPRVHKLFGMSKEKGISNILVGSAEIRESIIPTPVKNLEIITSGPIPPNPSELIGSKNMVKLLEVLKTRYDRIVIDSPPITAVTDSAILGGRADGVVLVVRAAETPRELVKNGVAQLRQVNAHVLGAILNGIKMGKDNYYYYQYYYYYYGEDGGKKKGSRKRKKSKGEYA